MNKRRRTSSITGRGMDDDEDSLPPEPVRRKKIKVDPAEIIQQLYDTIRNFKKEDGTLLCDSFIRAPKRRQEPAYYEVVNNPIDMLKVQQKIKTDEYLDVEDFTSDVEQIVNNAKAFYKKNSQEYKDATELWELLESTRSKLLDEPQQLQQQVQLAQTEEDSKSKLLPIKVPGRPGRKSHAAIAAAAAAAAATGNPGVASSSCQTMNVDIKTEETDETSEGSAEDELSNMCEDLFSAVMTATSEDGRLLHIPFQLLPSKKRYPKYYEVIENPLDLRMIATKIQQNKYCSLNEMEKDLIQMTRNACTFNEPGSQIYKDAKFLRKIVQAKKVEVEQGKYLSPGKGSERIRNKRLRSGQTMSAITAALKIEEEDEEDEDMRDEDMVDVEEPDNPCWQLFDSVKSYTTPQGQVLSEPFHKLPSKRYYPDYYKEIRNPVSFTQISKKLQKGDYGTVSEVAGDMNIMFENAKKYNRPDSNIYKDAVKLQKVMQKRVKELLDVDQQYSASEDDSADEPKKIVTPKFPNPPIPPQSSTTKLLTRGKYMDNIPLKKRLYILCKCLMNYMCEDGRQPMLMFMEKPSKKLYPDYYEVIQNPIDMLTIESNIKAEKYTCEEEILSDFKLMFSNCRKYNEVGSMIYEDAKKLEKVLFEKVKELGPLPAPGSPEKITVIEKEVKKTPKSASSILKPKKLITPSATPKAIDPSMSHKLRTLFHTIRDYKDNKGRQLSQIFLKLPSKGEYPDYYEVIKKPINLEQISQKLKANLYESLEDLCSDFILMFDNACKYNEPDSQIYKDALTLQKVAMQTKIQLRQDEQSVPDVPSAVQELLMSLFISVYNHQDEEGRCFSDSMQELPEHDEVDGRKIRALSLDLIKRRLDSGQYKRLDTFQEDIFSCLQRARNLSRSDSQVFEDSVELQSYFIRQRDDLCRNGDLLHSPALNYTLLDLSNAVDVERQTKQAQEQPEEEPDVKPFKDDGGSGMAGTADNALSYNQQVFRIGDFVYVEGKERGMDPMIINIQRLWTNQEGHQMLYGNQYFRPNETYHVTTRKFLEKEVFKTEQNLAIPLNQVLGRCCVLSVKDYFRSKPEGVDEKDVYVCESRYSSRARSFKKIKNWPQGLMTGYKLVQREEALEPKRVMSVFRQRVEKHKEEIAELEEQEKLMEKEKPNVPVTPAVENDCGFVYYEQLNTPNCVIKTGDCVYMKTDAGRNLIAQADTIWMNKEGEGFFRGPWVVMPSEIPHSPSRLFYKQEVFLSTLEDTHAVNNIVSKCVVLEHSEYISCRPTEFNEKDVYVCESMYDEAKRSVRELPREGLKKYTHSPQVTQDEIYFFRRLINPPKVPAESHTTIVIQQPPPQVTVQQTSAQTQNPVPQTPVIHHFENSVDSDVMMEDSMDGAPPSVGSADIPQSVISTPVGTKKVKGTGKKLVTGYILYSGDVRKGISLSNPECNFGEVSRIVGNEWRKLPASEKASWEERAARINEETNNKPLEEPPSPAAPTPTETVFECHWDNCDWQFEDLADAIDHSAPDGGSQHGHVYQYFQNLISNGVTDIEYQCQWRGCTRTKKTIPPFPSLQRLGRHVREVHLLKSTGRAISVDQKSKHFQPSRKAALLKTTTASPMPGVTLHAASAVTGGVSLNLPRNTPSPLTQNGNVTNSNGKILEPLFISVPPRPQRLLHSEAYIKYIEGLNTDNRSVSNWDKQLRASQTTCTPSDPNRLPGHWLSNGSGNHGNILNALWTLRDFMFRDALGISKHI